MSIINISNLTDHMSTSNQDSASQTGADSVLTSVNDDFSILLTPWSDDDQDSSEVQEPQPGCSFWNDAQPGKDKTNGMFIYIKGYYFKSV